MPPGPNGQALVLLCLCPALDAELHPVHSAQDVGMHRKALINACTYSPDGSAARPVFRYLVWIKADYATATHLRQYRLHDYGTGHLLSTGSQSRQTWTRTLLFRLQAQACQCYCRHSNALVDLLPPEADSSISLLSQSERPDVTYQARCCRRVLPLICWKHRILLHYCSLLHRRFAVKAGCIEKVHFHQA